MDAVDDHIVCEVVTTKIRDRAPFAAEVRGVLNRM